PRAAAHPELAGLDRRQLDAEVERKSIVLGSLCRGGQERATVSVFGFPVLAASRTISEGPGGRISVGQLGSSGLPQLAGTGGRASALGRGTHLPGRVPRGRHSLAFVELPAAQRKQQR